MIERARALLAGLHFHGWGVALWVGLVLVTGFASLALVSYFLVRLPETYFQAAHPPALLPTHPVLRALARIGKNLLGLVLVGAGVVMALPGVPGQGILTVLIGIMLVDFPGKRRLERRLIGAPRVLRSVNRLRARFGRAPLVLDREAGDPA